MSSHADTLPADVARLDDERVKKVRGLAAGLLGIGLLAGQWVHDNPLLGVGIAVVFAVILGFGIDHVLRWWHRRCGDGEPVPIVMTVTVNFQLR